MVILSHLQNHHRVVLEKVGKNTYYVQNREMKPLSLFLSLELIWWPQTKLVSQEPSRILGYQSKLSRNISFLAYTFLSPEFGEYFRCKHWNYPDDLPKVSVVIVFHNEGWSTLLRTVQSVIDRSPPQFLEEVLLVDDFSDKGNLGIIKNHWNLLKYFWNFVSVHLKKKLAEFIKKYDGKVRLIRNSEREGLIRTRTRGAKESKGEVVLFLDAHCEVGPNWLPPLLYPIYLDRYLCFLIIIVPTGLIYNSDKPHIL